MFVYYYYCNDPKQQHMMSRIFSRTNSKVLTVKENAGSKHDELESSRQQQTDTLT